MTGPARVAVVTGATGGIGSAVVYELVQAGFEVVAMGRDEAKLDELAHSPDVTGVEWDQETMTVPHGATSLERVDVLIHNAGVAPITPVSEVSADEWGRLFAINVTSAALLTQALLAGLRSAGGHVIFVNSSAGMHGIPGWSGYLGSKAALRELADTLRSEERAHGVRVTTVYPDAVATELLKRVREGFGASYDPEQCVSAGTAARLIASLLNHPADGYLTELSFSRT